MPDSMDFSKNAVCMNEPRARKLMSAAGVDVLLANSVWNVAYLSGFVQFHWVWDGIQHFMDRNAWRDEAKPLAGFCLDPAKSPFLASNEWVTRFNYVYPQVQIVTDNSCYDGKGSGQHANRFSVFMLDWAVKALRERGLEAARIGYEETRLPEYWARRLREALPRATFVPADDLFWQIRAVKTDEEIRRLREAFRIAAQIYRETFAAMRPGVTLGELTRMQMARAHELGGAWYFNHMWIHRPGTPWDSPADYRLQSGDEGSSDLGIYVAGYGCDFGRTVSVGEPHPDFRGEFESMREVYFAMREATRLGHTSADIYSATQRHVGQHRAGRASTFFVGHGLGLECHELPAALPTDWEPLEENMVIQLEVGSIAPPRNSFVFLEDAGVITKNGWEPLTDLPREVAVVG